MSAGKTQSSIDSSGFRAKEVKDDNPTAADSAFKFGASASKGQFAFRATAMQALASLPSVQTREEGSSSSGSSRDTDRSIIQIAMKAAEPIKDSTISSAPSRFPGLDVDQSIAVREAVALTNKNLPIATRTAVVLDGLRDVTRTLNHLQLDDESELPSMDFVKRQLIGVGEKLNLLADKLARSPEGTAIGGNRPQESNSLRKIAGRFTESEWSKLTIEECQNIAEKLMTTNYDEILQGHKEIVGSAKVAEAFARLTETPDNEFARAASEMLRKIYIPEHSKDVVRSEVTAKELSKEPTPKPELRE